MTANAEQTTEAKVIGTAEDNSAAARPGWHTTIVFALRDAEDLLDALEANGFEKRELLVLEDSKFAVRWQ
jgi:hypothetical protein